MADCANTTRRSFLKAAPAAAAAIAATTYAIETPEDRISRLSAELSSALREVSWLDWKAAFDPERTIAEKQFLLFQIA